MKLVRILTGLSLALFSIPANAQYKTIVHDGTSGIQSIEIKNDSVKVTHVIPKSPAWEAGIRGDDMILAIGDISFPREGYRNRDVMGLLMDKQGREVDLTIRKSGSDSLKVFRLMRDPNLSIWQSVDYEYLVDSSMRWTIEDILSDSINNLFSGLPQKKIHIHSVEKGSSADLIGIQGGDRILSLADEVDNRKYYILDYGFGGNTSDTSLTLIRDSTFITLDADPSEDHVLEGVTSQFMNDISQRCIWLKINTENRISSDRLYVLRVISSADTSFLYHTTSTGQLVEKMAGSLLTREQRDLVYKDWTVFKIQVKESGQQVFYIRLIADGFMSHVEPWLIPSERLSSYDTIERMIISLLGGMMLLIAFYYLVLFLSSREKNYLFYSLFILSFGFFLVADWGYLAELPWTFLDRITYVFFELVIALPVILFILFAISYLEIRKMHPLWYKLFLINIGLILVSAVIIIIEYKTNDSIEYSMFMDIIWYTYVISSLVVSFILLLVSVILRIRAKYKPAWYFLAAFIAMVGLLTFYQLTDSEFWFDTLYDSDTKTVLKNAGMHIGAVVQFLIFSIGLGQKMKGLEIARKKAQERIIAQLKENEQLKDKVNRELETKVQERTREISLQKEEIEAQRDEIEAQRDQLAIQRDTVVAQKQEITDSINYAQRIQEAVLPHKEYLDAVMPEYFVLYKPRDIVSGDFYWIKEVKNYLIVVAADCTGHGVPGAFMSMLGISLLNELVGKSRFDQPGEILDRLRKKVKETLAQEGKLDEQRDGMDMALAIINKDTLQLQFAGAFNPLYLVRHKLKLKAGELEEFSAIDNENYQLFEFKGDRQPISIHYEETDFTTREIQLTTGDTFYLISDGFIDQIGGPKRKKFLSKRFKRNLLELQAISLEEQHRKLEDTLEDWSKGYEQIDDILVMGVKV